MINFYEIEDKGMANGFRCHEARLLSEEEIQALKNDIRLIRADESIFIFNDPNHIIRTSYNPVDDLIYVGRNVFPDDRVFSTHPRDLLTTRAVLAHEYYGHRPERERYLKEDRGEIQEMPRWEDEVYASLNAACHAPGLSQYERAMLVNEAGARAQEANQAFKLTDELREILYGEWKHPAERDIVSIAQTIVFVSASG